MNEQQFLGITRRVMSDDRVLPVEISIKEAWLLISGLQLATRHPEISEHMRNALTDIARQFQGAITDLHPEAQAPLEMGWNSAHDVQPAPIWTKNSRRHKQ